MAKSKLMQANKKIETAVVGGYKTIENAVVEGYEKIEKAVLSGYTKIEDRFVDSFLVKDGETLPEAKNRLKNTNQF